VDPNDEWHSRHRLPENPTLDQRVTWHIEHARRCTCRHAVDCELFEELKRRYLNSHRDFWIFFNRDDHRALGQWAAECAEHVLPYFEERHREDTRPRHAIRTLREWVASGKFSMPVIRGASLAAHAAAKEVQLEDRVASFAAHAAGQAVGTAHVPTHAIGPVLYAIRLAAAANPTDPTAAIATERDWQSRRLPENLRWWADAWLTRTQNLRSRAYSSSGGE
jgi:hypothetical protein